MKRDKVGSDGMKRDEPSRQGRSNHTSPQAEAPESEVSAAVVHWQPDNLTRPACGAALRPGEGYARLERGRRLVTCAGCRAADPRQVDLFTGRPHVAAATAREPLRLPHVDAETALLPVAPVVHGGRVLPPVHVATLPPVETWCGRQGHAVNRSLNDGAASVALVGIAVGAVVGPDRLTETPDLVTCGGCLERRPRPLVSVLRRMIAAGQTEVVERQLSLWPTPAPAAGAAVRAGHKKGRAPGRGDRGGGPVNEANLIR